MDWPLIIRFLVVVGGTLGYGIYVSRRDREKRSRIPAAARWRDRLLLVVAALVLIVVTSPFFIFAARFKDNPADKIWIGWILYTVFGLAALAITVWFNRRRRGKTMHQKGSQ